MMSTKRVYKEIMVGSSDKIDIPDHINATITSNNPEIATVAPDGTIIGNAFGDTYIVVEDAEKSFKEIIDIRVLKPMALKNNLPTFVIPPEKQIIIDREPGQYLGHPDSVLLDDEQTILTVYPLGHGIGEAVINISRDFGYTWEGRRIPNETWKESRETPTIYKLDFTDGSQKLICITGGPGWGDDKFKGWKTSISTDQGETWSDKKIWYEGTQTMVAMSSLVRLKDENGNWMDKWLGIYHDGEYVNYKTYLTFNENGEEQWSKPKSIFPEHRDVEKEVMLCEACIFRSPDGKQLALLARSQSHMHRSTISFSNDEGMTWTRPREVPGALNGERHKASYDPISGRLVICFREIILDYNDNGLIEDDDWMAGDWVAWVGTYDDLVNGNDGEYRILLGEDFTPSRKSGDCGYAGNVVRSDGTFFLNSYGHFDKEEVDRLGTDVKPYIMGVHFKLSDFDQMKK